MRANRTVLPMLIIASLAVDLGFVASIATPSMTWANPCVAIVLGLAAGQINLATIWSVLGYHHLPWRTAASFLVPIGWSCLIVTVAPHIRPSYGTAAKWGIHFLTHTVLLASILIPIRLAGARLLPGYPSPNEPRPRAQFQLRHLFAWLTATAIILSALKTTFENVEIAPSDIRWLEIAILGFVSAMLGLSCVWVICDVGPLPRRLGATFATALPAACAVGWVALMAGPASLIAVLLLWLIAGLYSAIALAVLRVSGFRLVWAHRSPAAHRPS